MLKIKSYVKVNSIEEAYELNQKKTAIVLGGMVWLKMGNRNISTAIDLSGLGLAGIQETDEEFVIGCMTTLRELETDKRLNEYTQGAVRESVRHIVGVQFRNCATVGGSIWGRYGFSDVLTMFLGMDTWVELHNAGKIPLTEFVDRKKDNDILVNIIVKKQPLPVFGLFPVGVLPEGDLVFLISFTISITLVFPSLYSKRISSFLLLNS